MQRGLLIAPTRRRAAAVGGMRSGSVGAVRAGPVVPQIRVEAPASIGRCGAERPVVLFWPAGLSWLGLASVRPRVTPTCLLPRHRTQFPWLKSPSRQQHSAPNKPCNRGSLPARRRVLGPVRCGKFLFESLDFECTQDLEGRSHCSLPCHRLQMLETAGRSL